MANEHQEPPGEERQLDASIRKLHEEFHQFMHECQACQHEIAPHWQVCAHCGVRLATHCPGCGNPLPPAGAQACPRCGVAVPQGES
jgi:rRNA maturation endonuclease Nob1